MSDILERICDDKRRHIAARKNLCPQPEIELLASKAPEPRGFAAALGAAVTAGAYGLIAEIKKSSPSKGLIREDFQPTNLAQAYRAGGATCLSVLTDAPYFEGRDEDLSAARSATPLPVLRKDFTLDSYQVYEARALGADCILLILTALDDAEAKDFADLARELRMDALLEVHDEAELERGLRLDSRLVGINNRNLKSLEVDVATTERLAPLIPHDRIAISESGLANAGDLARMAAADVHCFLIGEALMRQQDVEAATRSLMSVPASATA